VESEFFQPVMGLRTEDDERS